MELLSSNIQHYHWGDYSFIPELQSRADGNTPEAELWMGAHPTSPSRILRTEQGLDEIISNNPKSALGPNRSLFGDELPFIMKILAIRSPLSIQVHPNTKQAEKGFTAEQKEINQSQFYSSPRGKEEVVCALSETDLKFGFRELHEIRTIIDAVGQSEFHQIAEGFLERPSEQTLKEIIEKILSMGPNQVESIATAVLSSNLSSTPIQKKEVKYFDGLVNTYPNDPGLLIFLLMNFITLHPGDFLYVPPGVTHVYLSGNVVEITSNSDNVIRCGLTPKDINSQEYLSIASFLSEKPEIQKPLNTLHSYVSPTPFSLSRLLIEGEWETSLIGPEILISTHNNFDITNALGESLKVAQGQPVWVPYSDTGYKISGHCMLFRCATVPSL
ncbi:MAG: mannose-6-phosphate isomerase, class I [Acidimicrobiaceae bacterium]|jgi:mannose-6-phosphate isomerase|nr:mannose-6-phosphate isomerase, class I [Acidimicrobiaceae bacterium]|tara:strand:+ start:2460 stop:3617 length:1158 start_codon:yes stop_codon:yes gene_type:complete